MPGLVRQFKLSPASARFMGLWHALGDPDSRHDMFWGQVPALHPLSAFVMEREEHRVAIGEWLHLAAPGEATPRPPERDSAAYRGALAAVLTAAAEYKLAWQQARRSSPEPEGSPSPTAATASAGESPGAASVRGRHGRRVPGLLDLIGVPEPPRERRRPSQGRDGRVHVPGLRPSAVG